MGPDDRSIRFPVSCPICRKEFLTEYRQADVVGALLNDRPICLYAPCCDKSWTAGYIEMQQIRAYCGAARAEAANRTLPAKPPKASDD